MDNQVSTGALIVVAASGGMGALIAGLTTAYVQWRLDRTRRAYEQRTWLRDRKFEVYSDASALLMRVGSYARARSETPLTDEIRMRALDLVERKETRLHEIAMLMDSEKYELLQNYADGFEDGEYQDATRLLGFQRVLKEDLDAT